MRRDVGVRYSLSLGSEGKPPARPTQGLVVDVDQSPWHLLHPGGVFALWSNEPPDDDCAAALADRSTQVRAEVVRFPTPLRRREATSTVYVAKAAG